MTDIYRLGLHGQAAAETALAPMLITRVPGGWIYTFYNQVDQPTGERMSSVFVPFDNEFDK